ncbi:MAG: DNA recombination protein RmuC, partial [Sulfurovum sp.]|nr:DNA recombination protein RmuC [Sulfurovum sp.]
MQNWIEKFQHDSTFLFIVSIALVVLLVIVLIVVIYSTKSKTLAQKVAELQESLFEKERKIEKLEQELT